jgi:hypothetical protein
VREREGEREREQGREQQEQNDKTCKTTFLENVFFSLHQQAAKDWPHNKLGCKKKHD